MKKRTLNAKEIINALAIYSDDQRDLNEHWDTFNLMRRMGFITEEEWAKVFGTCSSWAFEGGKLVDADTGAVVEAWIQAREGRE